MERLNRFLDKKRNLYIFAVCAILFESLSAPFLKFGGQYPLFSPMYLFWFGMAVLVMVGYALTWQLILERLPLTTAYLRKGITYVMAFVWAIVFFHEDISFKQVLGILVIISGMVVSMSDEL